MLGILMQISRFGFLALLWWFIFRALAAIRRDMIKNNFTVTKSRLAQAMPSQLISQMPQRDISHSLRPATPYSRSYATMPVYSLVITTGPAAGEKFPLNSENIFIGYSPDCTIIFNDDFISPVHAKLSKSGEQWYLEDLGSTNGTFLDKIRITSSVLVPPYTPIRMGKTVFELQS